MVAMGGIGRLSTVRHRRLEISIGVRSSIKKIEMVSRGAKSFAFAFLCSPALKWSEPCRRHRQHCRRSTFLTAPEQPQHPLSPSSRDRRRRPIYSLPPLPPVLSPRPRPSTSRRPQRMRTQRRTVSRNPTRSQPFPTRPRPDAIRIQDLPAPKAPS